MSSNFLSANTSKTGFIFFRKNGNAPSLTVRVGNDIIEEKAEHKILGLTFNNKLTWTGHIAGKNGLISSLNRRVGALKRLKHQIPQKYLADIANAIITSKIRYGLCIYGDTRIKDTDPQTKNQKDLQITLNNVMRIIAGKRLTDKIPIQDLSATTGIRSLNHLSAEDKVKLMWNSLNSEESSLYNVFNNGSCGRTDMMSRARTRGDVRQTAKSKIATENLPNTAIEIWNKCHQNLLPLRTGTDGHKKKIVKLIRQEVKILPF
jgi:hypothetical protein